MRPEDEAPSPRDEPPTSSDLTELIQEALARPLPLRHRLSDWWRRTVRRRR